MENPDQRAAVVSKVLHKYRKVVRILRIAPFIYLIFFALFSLSSVFLPERLVCFLDCAMIVSPVTTFGAFLLSGVLGMCRWHKTACLLPYSAKVISFIDTNLVTFTQNELTIINGVIGFIILFFITLAVKHFLCTTSPKI